MKTKIFLLVISIFFINCIELISGEWIVKYEINSPTSNTFGLTWDGEFLWLSSNTNTFYKIDPVNGNVISQFQIDLEDNAEDLAWDGEYLWVCDKMSFVTPKFIHKIDTLTKQIIQTIELDALQSSNLNGLTYCDGQLIAGDAEGNLYFINPNNGQLEETIQVPPGNESGTDGLTWDNSHLWLSHNNGTIYKLDKDNGSIIDSFEAPSGAGDGPEGLAWDGSFIWYADNSEDKIYQLELLDQKVWGSFEPNSYDIIICNSIFPTRSVRYDISSYNTIDSAKLTFGYFNFDWIVNEYPDGITKEFLDFNVTIDQNIIYQIDNITDDKTKSVEIDINPYITNPDSLIVEFNNTLPDDALGIVQPVLLITGSQSTNGINEYGTHSLQPTHIILQQNYPNPFSGTTEIEFQIKKAGKVEVYIYSIEGEKIINLMNEYKNIGNYSVTWNTGSQNGNKIYPGTYFYSVKLDGVTVSKKLIISQ